MEKYTQADVAALRELMRDGMFQKMQRWSEDLITNLELKNQTLLASLEYTADQKVLAMVKNSGKIEGLRMFIGKPEKMLKSLVSDEGAGK